MGIERRVIGVPGFGFAQSVLFAPKECDYFCSLRNGLAHHGNRLCADYVVLTNLMRYFFQSGGPLSYTLCMKPVKIGYARCSTDKQNLAVRRAALNSVAGERIFADQRLTDTSRAQPGLDRVPAVVRPGDRLVLAKLDRLPCSVPDARATDELSGSKLAFGSGVCDPTDRMGNMVLNIPVTSAAVEADLIPIRNRRADDPTCRVIKKTEFAACSRPD
jgi:hypothetical protein